ncbi:MAG: acyl-CoA thioesterase [Candidatus Hydrogenedens sp.]|nr:acyl-CoA thioesterase [Candidatus Hydrogenedens sp.]
MMEAREDRKPLRVLMPLRVQTYDIDFAGHVNNQVYVRWLEDLRMEMLRLHYPIERLMAEGLAPILATTHVEYKRSLVLGDNPEGEMWVTKMGRATCHLHAEIRLGEAVCALAHQRIILLNIGTTRPARFPAPMVARFESDNAA